MMKSMFFKETREQLTSDNRVTINIWKPRLNGEYVSAQEAVAAFVGKKFDPSTGDRVGHVSVETDNFYASWWPKPQSNEDAERIGVFNCVAAVNSTYKADCISENSDPETKVCLYSLDAEKIEACFKNVEEADYGYVLAGDKTTTRWLNNEKGQSCSGLAYEILLAGGLSKLMSSGRDFKARFLVSTPDNLATLLEGAKVKELSDYPETGQFQNEGTLQLSSPSTVP